MVLVRLTETSEKIQIQIASDAYRPCSIRASVLYFVLKGLAQIDPMYQSGRSIDPRRRAGLQHQHRRGPRLVDGGAEDEREEPYTRAGHHHHAGRGRKARRSLACLCA